MTEPPSSASIVATRKRIERLAALLDGAIRIPGTRFRFGIEALIGLIPGIGDALGLLLGGTILFESVRVGAPRGLILRMLRNSAVDALGGLVPVVGDIFDFAFKSNRRNAHLLLNHLDEQMRTEKQAERSGRFANVLIVGAALAALVALLVLALRALWGAA